MRRHKSQKSEKLGTGTVRSVVEDDLDWILRDEALPDYGVDAQIEILTDDQIVTGRLIAVQIKGGAKWFRSRSGDDGWTFKESTKHLSYWLGYSLPVIVVIVDPQRRAYWEVITPATVTEHEGEEEFSIVVRRNQPFDATARDKLLALAGRREGLLELLPSHYAVLPPAAVEALGRAEPVDHLATARLAERLAAGREMPDFMAASIVSAQPSWLAGSPAAQDLWCAVGAYADQHKVRVEAGRAYRLAAACDGPRSARSLAAAGLAFLDSDRAEARLYLERAREEGQVLLADIGLSLITLAEGDARAVSIPDSISAADPAELEAEPSVLLFLADMAHRRGDLDVAVERAEQAVVHSSGRETVSRLTLGWMIFRRALAGDMSGRELRRAIGLAREVVEERRRWDGPSAEALALLLDIYIILGDMPAAVSAALPASWGGTARDTEATRPEIARRAALAALSVGNRPAYEFFLEQLPDGPNRRELLATKADAEGRPVDERIAERRALLDSSIDDDMKARNIASLVKLGVWPPQADEMHARGVLPDEVYRILAAVDRARGDDAAIGVAQLREMSATSVHAAMELIDALAEVEGPDSAIEEAQRQVARRRHPDLGLKLLDLLGKHGRDDEASELLKPTISDDSVPAHTRLQLAVWYVSREGQAGRYAEAAAFADRALEIGDDPDLVWLRIKSLHNAGRVDAARQALTRHHPEPVSDDEMRLWMQLHIGIPLAPVDVPAMIRIAERQPDGQFRDATIRLLVREVLLAPDEETRRFPVAIVDAVGRLQEQAANRPGSALSLASDDDESLRAAMQHVQPDPAEYDALLERVRQGLASQADIATFVGRSYGAALIQRPAGLIPAIDLRSGLRSAGEIAAEAALDSRACVADLSALHLLGFLSDDFRLRIRAALPELVVARTAIGDATLTREQLRSQSIATYTAVIQADGKIERSTLTPQQRAVLREQSERLEYLAASLDARMPASPANAAKDAISVAKESELALWCDDVSLRQIARQADVATFNTLDLITVLHRRFASIDEATLIRTLAVEYVVDLPLGADDLIAIGEASSWAGGPIHTVLGRAEWWRFQGDEWATTWRTIAVAACKTSPESFVSITKTALFGSLSYVPPGQSTQRYQRLVTLALAACHEAGEPAPDEFLAGLAAIAAPGVAPEPKYVYGALVLELQSQGVGDAAEVAQRLMPGVDLG